MGASVDRTAVEQGQQIIEASELSWRLPSPGAIAGKAHESALVHSGELTNMTRLQVIEALHRGDRSIVERYRYALAKHVAEALGALDEAVKAVYVVQYDATPEDLCFGAAGVDLCIHLLAHVRRRTHALDALAAALDRALVQQYRDTLDAPGMLSLLDLRIVDDTDVARRSGYGAMLSSIHLQPLPLWERD